SILRRFQGRAAASLRRTGHMHGPQHAPSAGPGRDRRTGSCGAMIAEPGGKALVAGGWWLGGGRMMASIIDRRRKESSMRLIYVATAVSLLVVAGRTVSAQDASRVIAGGGISVPQWTGKIDANEEQRGRTLNDAKLTKEGDTFHVTTGP